MLVPRLGNPIWLALFTLAGIGVASAADYTPAPPPPQPVYIQRPVEEFSGWYLRGDIGFSNQSVGSLYNDNYNLSGTSEVVNADKGFDAAPFIGVGVGYSFNDWLRADVTAEYRGNANFHGYDRAHLTSGDWADDNYSGSKSELTFLFNAYVDLGTWYHLTPFVGAGIGMSRNTISNFTDVGIYYGSDVYADTASKWSLAWAVYAGVGYQISKYVTLEFAYRYLDLGDATTGDIHNAANTPDVSYTPFEFQNMTSQDFKLGLRFNFYEEQPAPVRYYAPPPPPVYSPPPPLSSRG